VSNRRVAEYLDKSVLAAVAHHSLVLSRCSLACPSKAESEKLGLDDGVSRARLEWFWHQYLHLVLLLHVPAAEVVGIGWLA